MAPARPGRRRLHRHVTGETSFGLMILADQGVILHFCKDDEAVLHLPTG